MIVRCRKCDHHILVLADGNVFSHYGDDGQICPTSDKPYCDGQENDAKVCEKWHGQGTWGTR